MGEVLPIIVLYCNQACTCTFNEMSPPFSLSFQGSRRRNREEYEDERDRRRHSSPGRGRDWSPPPHKRMRREPW